MTWAYRLEGPMHFVRHDIPAPVEADLAPGQVLLRFLAGGICGSDIPRCYDGLDWDGPQPWGRSLHEIVGEVVASNADLAIGERVVGWVADCCGLREYVPTPANELLPAPAGLDDVRAVALQPLACVLHAVSRLPDPRDTRVAVIGLGPIGLLFAHALKDAGAAQVVGVDAVDRRDVADRFGLDVVEHRTSRMWAQSPRNRDAFDLVIEAVGHQVGTMDDAITVAAEDGAIVYFGNPDDLYYPLRFGTMMDKSLSLHAGRTARPHRRDALRRAFAYVERHPALLEHYVSHVLPVQEAQRAFELVSHPRSGQLKVVLDGTGDAT